MCGINGFIFYKEKTIENNLKYIRKMNKQIVHRGPDEAGEYANSYAAVGMTRLSIIDLENGKQPIHNEQDDLCIVLNGEIYNYKELRESLIAKGHVFKTNSDTETVLHAYEEHGTDCLRYIKGMFAFAILDKRENILFIARDRMGEKPLYYACTEEFFMFASEIKSILATRLHTWPINRTALSQYFLLTYIPAPLSILEGVYKLEPGHYMKISVNGAMEDCEYWDVAYNRKEQITDYATCKKLLRETLYEAVEKCMVSDVPVGSFMSGGIDSTIVTGIMADLSDVPVDSFTIGFTEKAYDESDRAAIAAKHFRTNHHMEMVGYDEMLEVIEQLVDNMDEPFADSSLIPTYILSKLAKKNVKTVLTGDAGDELFGGYDKYLIGYYSEKYNRVPAIIRNKIVEPLVFAIPDKSFLSRKVRKVVTNSSLNSYEQHKNLMCLGVSGNQIGRLLSFDDLNSFDRIEACYYRYADFCDPIECGFYTDEKIVLEGDMLAKVDRASMLASLETRVPMLYSDMVELSAKIPSQYKLKGKKKKIILKDTFSDLLPQEILNAPKNGFGIPLGKWMRNEMKRDLLDTLREDTIREQNLFNWTYIETLLQEHMSEKQDHTAAIWAIYLFQKWYTHYYLVQG